MPQLGSLDLPVEAGQEGELWLGRPGTSFSAGCRAFSATDNYYAVTSGVFWGKAECR